MRSFTKFPEFDRHELVAPVIDPDVGLRGFIAIHRPGKAKRSLGATRVWPYRNETDALRDALRLSRLMSYKAALAGLPYGGAKAALIGPPPPGRRRAFFEHYARVVDCLGGRFVTGTDVGVTDADVGTMRRRTRFVIGRAVDPAYYTALGVNLALREALRAVYGSPSLEGRTVAIQGLGKTGWHILAMVARDAKEVYVADIKREVCARARREFSRIKIVTPDRISAVSADIFMPCALNGALSRVSLRDLKADIVVGSANNQLADGTIDGLLFRRGILYVPDYVANAGGLVSVADEMVHGRPERRRIIRRLGRIGKNLRTIFARSLKEKKPTGRVADLLAEAIFNR